MTTLILGCGYLGRHAAALIRARGGRVVGVVRTPESASSLAASGIEPAVADVRDPRALESLPAADRILYCVGYDRSLGVPIREIYVDGLRRALDVLAPSSQRWVFISSTGVYGQRDGEWVDESSPAVPVTESGRACLDAERSLADRVRASGSSATVVRCSGLYGEGRVIGRAGMEAGRPVAGDPEGWLNLIHVEDAAAVAVALLERPAAEWLYLATDDRPLRRREYYELLAESLGLPPPRFEPSEVPSGSESSKRVSNRRIREDLGVVLRYPEIRDGLPAALGRTAASGRRRPT